MDIREYIEENHRLIRYLLRTLGKTGDKIEFQQTVDKERLEHLLSFANQFINTIHIQREKTMLNTIAEYQPQSFTESFIVGLIIDQGKACNAFFRLQTNVEKHKEGNIPHLFKIAHFLREYNLSTLKHLHHTEEVLYSDIFQELTDQQYDTLQQKLTAIESEYANDLPHLPPEIRQLTDNRVVQKLSKEEP